MREFYRYSHLQDGHTKFAPHEYHRFSIPNVYYFNYAGRAFIPITFDHLAKLQLIFQLTREIQMEFLRSICAGSTELCFQLVGASVALSSTQLIHHRLTISVLWQLIFPVTIIATVFSV